MHLLVPYRGGSALSVTNVTTNAASDRPEDKKYMQVRNSFVKQ